VRNQYLDPGTAQEINKLIDRMHKDLGDPYGAIELAPVRDLLQLDLHYYTADDPSLLQEVVHRMRVGAKQIIRRPALLLDAIKKFDLKGLFIPDRKRILLDSTLPELKKRWSESHEIIHSLIPWHKEYLLGDTKETLSPGCHQQLECEANYGAGRLLFPHKPLLDIARSNGPSIAHVRSIATHFGNTITSALWRYIEYSEKPCVGVIGEHPHHMAADGTPIAYFIRSPRFETEFGSVTEAGVFELIRGYCAYKKSGPLGTAEITLLDARGIDHIFQAETFGNSYQVLTLVSYVRPAPVAVPRASGAFP
jgi:Zn-dependent peptidase ImmA (M78 family)